MSIQSLTKLVLVGAAITITLSGCMLKAASRRGLDLMDAGNCKAAVDIMRPAAESGDGYSINNLGIIWEHGCPDAGMTVDYAEAYRNFIIAGQKGVPIAFSNAAMLAEGGTPDMPPDLSLAIQLYTMGARYGDPASKNALARLGQVVPGPDLDQKARQSRQEEHLDIALAVLDALVTGNNTSSVTAPTFVTQSTSVSSGYVGTALWTGKQEQVTTVTNKLAWKCEYSYGGKTFWRVLEGSCPLSVRVQ